MSLTYQPFAEISEVQRLSRDLHMNVSEGERLVSGVLGATLGAAAISRGGATRWALLLVGGALLHRAFTGHCRLYERLELDKRHGRSGVPGNRGTRIEASVEIERPAATLYAFWRKLEQMPKILRHVRSVEPIGGTRSHWRVAGPAGQTFEWDAEIINEKEGRLLAWQSLPGSTVSHAGSVWFEPSGSGATRVKVALEFDPPGGTIGTAIGEWFGMSPRQELEDDLQRFKQFAESALLSGSTGKGEGFHTDI
jgi:uncharacterized membrane protein